MANSCQRRAKEGEDGAVLVASGALFDFDEAFERERTHPHVLDGDDESVGQQVFVILAVGELAEDVELTETCRQKLVS